MMTKDGLIFEANSLKQGRLQALTRQQLQAQATQNRERRWVAPNVLRPEVTLEVHKAPEVVHVDASEHQQILLRCTDHGNRGARGPRLIGAPAAARAWPIFAAVEHAVSTSHVSYKSRHETA